MSFSKNKKIKCYYRAKGKCESCLKPVSIKRMNLDWDAHHAFFGALRRPFMIYGRWDEMKDYLWNAVMLCRKCHDCVHQKVCAVKPGHLTVREKAERLASLRLKLLVKKRVATTSEEPQPSS